MVVLINFLANKGKFFCSPKEKAENVRTILGKFSVWENLHFFAAFFYFFIHFLTDYLFFCMFAAIINVNHIIKDFIKNTCIL